MEVTQPGRHGPMSPKARDKMKARVRELESTVPLRMMNDGDGVRIVAPSLGLDVTGESPMDAQAKASEHVATLTPEWASSLDDDGTRIALDAIAELWTYPAEVAGWLVGWRTANGWTIRGDHFVRAFNASEGETRAALVAVQANAFGKGLVN